MKEKKKPQKQTTGGGDGSVFDGAFGALPEPMVSVSSGPYAENLPVGGMPVGEVRKKFGDRFDIDDEAQAIVNGNPVDEEHVLKTGENLMFVRHAGEKGVEDRVVIEGTQAKTTTPEGALRIMELAELLPRLRPELGTGPLVLPNGVKAVLSQDRITVLVYEKPPHIAKLGWIRADSPHPYGPGTTYRSVRIALPYLLILATFYQDNGLPKLMLRDECFFRTEPLGSLDDELCYPGLLNCSKFQEKKGNPLSWICTQYLKRTKKMQSPNPNDRYQAGFEAVRYCLLETSFNLSSEHHEGNSWYGESKKIDPRIATIEEWEQNTKRDPLFVLDVPWINTGHSLKQVVDRIFQNANADDLGVRNATDLARIITQG